MLRKVAQKLRNTAVHEIILILIILTGIISVAFADIMSKTAPPIHNTGKIIPEITAKSGYWQDIQAAVNLAATLGAGIVHIPEGTWNFVNVSESWTGARVTIPAGVDVSGAPTERDANGQVVEWKTVLVMPWDVPGSDSVGIPTWFRISGSADPSKPSRFSDIELVGYRHIDNSSISMHIGVSISSVINFRVDHCNFLDTCGGGVQTSGHYCCGVIDHCRLVNENGVPDPYANRTVGYAIFPTRAASETEWDSNIQNILGKYLNYSVFIEDCYFSRWRHVVAGNWGNHYVFRYNIIENGFALAEIDLHPSYSEPCTGCRAAEAYENILVDPNPISINWAGQVRGGGGGCIFNNTMTGYDFLIFLYDCDDLYLWDNTLNGGTLLDHSGGVQENVNYFLYKPDWYTPYPYPHPLTSS